MRKLLRVLLLLVVLPAALWSGAVGAQSASCAGVAAWNATTIYNAGDKMVYNNHLYQASTEMKGEVRRSGTTPPPTAASPWHTLQ